MAKQEKPAKPSRAERQAIKKDEKALSGNKFGCPDCGVSVGTEDMLGIHMVLAHGAD
jgi:hypothetical protein